MPFENIQAKKSESAVDFIINSFKTQLETHELKPGDKIPNETELADIFSVSRGSVREAMKILSALGVIDIQRGNGTFIRKADTSVGIDSVLFTFLLMNPSSKEMFDFRAAVEREVIYLAVENATDEDIKKLKENIKLFSTPSPKENAANEKENQDMEFHRLLGAATHNGFMERIYSFAMNYFKPLILRSYKKQGEVPEDSVHTHSVLFEPIEKRDKNMVEKAIEESSRTWQYLLDLK